MAERPVERVYTTSWPDMRTAVETRSAPSGSPSRTIGGYAAVFGRRSQPLGGFREVVEPSFFNKTLGDQANVICRYEHDKLMLLGTTRAGTLRLKADEIGLDYSCDLPESRSDVWESVSRGDVPGSSFEFQVFQDDWRPSDGGQPLRHLISGKLIDVGPTAVPAYLDSTVDRRSGWVSLANHLDAPYDDVVRYAQQDDLRRFFIRTDQRTATIALPAPLVDPETPPETPEVKAEEIVITQEELGKYFAEHPELLPKLVEAKVETPAPEVKSEPVPEVKVETPAPEVNSEPPFVGKSGQQALMEILARRPEDPIK